MNEYRPPENLNATSGWLSGSMSGKSKPWKGDLIRDQDGNLYVIEQCGDGLVIKVRPVAPHDKHLESRRTWPASMLPANADISATPTRTDNINFY